MLAHRALAHTTSDDASSGMPHQREAPETVELLDALPGSLVGRILFAGAAGQS